MYYNWDHNKSLKHKDTRRSINNDAATLYSKWRSLHEEGPPHVNYITIPINCSRQSWKCSWTSNVCKPNYRGIGIKVNPSCSCRFGGVGTLLTRSCSCPIVWPFAIVLTPVKTWTLCLSLRGPSFGEFVQPLFTNPLMLASRFFKLFLFNRDHWGAAL